MSRRVSATVLALIMVLTMVSSLSAAGLTLPANQEPETTDAGIYRGVITDIQFDISPPLRDIAPLQVKAGEPREIPERDTGLEGPLGPQDVDAVVQNQVGTGRIPGPIISFDGPSNLAGVSPPDPVGDVGPNHYVAMSNLYWAVYDKTGTLLLGPLPNNSLWAGFGGDCQTDNSGDPIVVYDQLADRWILTQFTSSGPTYFNCVAISTSGDPTSTYYRYAIGTGTNFPDYPKYGVWPDAYYISTREFAGPNFAGIGAYALDRAQMIAGNPAPTVISFLVPPGAAPYNVGDGLLPTDLDGFTPPPADTPNYYVGSMDDGGQYGAPQDALTIWEFDADFVTPALSTFTLANTLPVAAFDSQFPCSPGSRDCIPQPDTANKVDVQSYRQRPIWRLAYRNFGSHESLVTNQSVEAAPNMAGVRWYEVRDPGGTPTVYQQGTYAPGVSDGIHRWFGSVAMDSAGNMALGYSASNATTTYPSVWYTGRLAGDPLGTMPQGEASIIDGTGSQTGSQRWGDYTSMNVDPVDDCTFWYVNQYIPVTSSIGWKLRIGAFRFDECGTPDFTLSATPNSQAICVPDSADYTVDVGSIMGFNDPVDLGTSGEPAGATINFSVDPVTPPGSSTLTVGTAAIAGGNYSFDVTGTSTTGTKFETIGLDVFDSVPAAPALLTPPDNATGVASSPTYTWSDTGATSYTIEVATDAGFTNIVDSATVPGTTYNGAALAPTTAYYWRVSASNACGTTPATTYFTFTTADVVCSAPQLGIPDSGQVSDTIVVASGGILTDLDVYLNVPHTWVGDLAFTLEHVDTGTTATIVDRPGNPATTFGCSGNDYDVTVNDEGPDGDIETQCDDAPAIWGDRVGGDPPGPVLAAFDGESFAGSWELTISDNAGGDTGTLMEWCLIPSDDGTEPPNIYVDPLSLGSAQPTNTSVNQTLSISNTGGGMLDWLIEEEDTTTPRPAPAANSVPERLGTTAPGGASPQSAPSADVIQDGSFEAGTPNPFWTEFSLNFGTPLCDVPSCGTGTGTGPLTGAWWAWFGGIGAYEEGSVSQVVNIPSGSPATLTFWTEQIVCDSVADYMEVTVDGTQVWMTDGSDPACGVLGYREITVDVSAWADDGPHTLEFHSEIFANNGGGSNFFVDDVVLDAGNGGGPCQVPSDIPWLSLSQYAGSNAGGTDTDVTVTFDSTGLADGVYTGNLCV
ncbi:MAG: proprotein convertase P-domain-containing protein, partial [Chloroflexota bacterium]|nr:proprotein convertase P-domain-containing protein [Chloroflexota bacterium]